MTTRRTFIKTLAAIPPLLPFAKSLAAGPDPSRLALVIGNGAYRDAALVNPANDAKAMGSLLGQAGFKVDTQVDADRNAMMAAIERFGAAAGRAETKLALFYYAGHGAQLDWRNYLLPVDAVVETAEHMKQRCVDLGVLLKSLSGAKDKTFVVILDACRNDPFGGRYRPEQKGLSQFDAPVGSLLAYATSPGNVASDGSGQNGLYTENLVRELSARNARVEDALKRVRLNVRLASGGAQIPWETTSLEGDVYLFGEGAKKLSDAEIEKAFEAEIEEWNRIKNSRKADDWVGYLRQYPNGRFAEIAQVRLNRLLAAAVAVPAVVAVVAPAAVAAAPVAAAAVASAQTLTSAAVQAATVTAKSSAPAPIAAVPSPTPVAMPTPAPSVSAAPAIDIKAGSAVPQLMAQSHNPYSAGRYPLGRKYTVGDEATFRESDLLTGIQVRVYTQRVTRVDVDNDLVEVNDGRLLWDMMGNPLKSGPTVFDVPVQNAPAELQVGKKWTAAFKRTQDGQTSNAFYDMQIVAREKVTVPAGTFDAFKVVGEGWNTTYGAKLEIRLWLVPGIGFAVKREWITLNKWGKFAATEKHELVWLRQHAVDLS